MPRAKHSLHFTREDGSCISCETRDSGVTVLGGVRRRRRGRRGTVNGEGGDGEGGDGEGGDSEGGDSEGGDGEAP